MLEIYYYKSFWIPEIDLNLIRYLLHIMAQLRAEMYMKWDGFRALSEIVDYTMVSMDIVNAAWNGNVVVMSDAASVTLLISTAVSGPDDLVTT